MWTATIAIHTNLCLLEPVHGYPDSYPYSRSIATVISSLQQLDTAEYHRRMYGSLLRAHQPNYQDHTIHDRQHTLLPDVHHIGRCTNKSTNTAGKSTEKNFLVEGHYRTARLLKHLLSSLIDAEPSQRVCKLQHNTPVSTVTWISWLHYLDWLMVRCDQFYQ